MLFLVAEGLVTAHIHLRGWLHVAMALVAIHGNDNLECGGTTLTVEEPQGRFQSSMSSTYVLQRHS
jgi:hypothetical protein